MTPYFYAPLQMPVTDGGERRTVAVLVADMEGLRTFLSCLPLDKATFWDAGGRENAAGILRDITDQAQSAIGKVQTPASRSFLDWWTAKAANREDFVRLERPMPGLSNEIEDEAARILRRITGMDAMPPAG
jgi:hypothetical protein